MQPKNFGKVKETEENRRGKGRNKRNKGQNRKTQLQWSQVIQVKVQNTNTLSNVPLSSGLSVPLTSDLREVVCFQRGSWISTHDGWMDRVKSYTVGKVVLQRSDVQGRSSFINPDRRAWLWQHTDWEPSGSFARKSRLRKHQHRNHKGEDGTVFPEEKAKISTQSWGKSFAYFIFLTTKKDSYFPLIWIIFSIHDSALMPNMSGHVFSPCLKLCSSFPLPKV